MLRLRLLRGFFRALFAVLTRIEAVGLENIPETGGCVLAVNHMSRLDAPLVFILLKRQDVTGLVADKYLNYPFLKFIIDSVKGIYINRESADIRALKEVRKYLMEGGALSIAPEGTRSRVGALIPAKTGVAYLAEKAHVPVIPIVICGTEDTMQNILRLQRPRIRVQVGRPLNMRTVGSQDHNHTLERNTDEVMCHIAAMLPPRYWGAYAAHLRIQEILASGDEAIPGVTQRLLDNSLGQTA